MNKPSGYDDYKIGDGARLPAGGYICKVMRVEETASKSGKAMLVIYLDIAEGNYKDYYTKKYKNNKNQNKKWGCRSWALTEGEYISNFMTFCKSVEESDGKAIQWGDNFAAQFKGRKVGAIFRDEEFEGNTGVASATKVYSFLPVERIKKGEFVVPEKKTLNKASIKNGYDGFTEVDDDEDLPF